MSARQQNRLRSLASRDGGLVREDPCDSLDSDSDSDGIIKTSRAQRFSAALLDDISESDSSDDSESSESNSVVKQRPAAPSSSSKSSSKGKAQQPSGQEDIAALDDLLLEELGVNNVGEVGAPKRTRMDILLGTEEGTTLDLSSIMRSKMAAMKMTNITAMNSNFPRKVAARHNASAQRRVLLGPPDEDWVRPPHFIAGGITFTPDKEQQAIHDSSAGSFSATEAVVFYKLEFSREYASVDNMYKVVTAIGDVNRLFLFVLQHPYHCEALVSLAMVYLRTGGVETAHKLVRRCIYILERAFKDGATLAQSSLRISAKEAINRVIFTSLFRHAQMCSNLGAVGLAADITKIIFKLDPCDDPFFVLLSLDTLCLGAKRFDFIDNFYSEFFLELPPSWGYSRALSLFLRGDRTAEAGAALLEMVSTHPCALLTILTKADVNVKSPLWSTIFSHKFFVKTLSFMKDLKARKGSCALDHIFECYSIRSKGLWGRETVVHWIERTLRDALSSDERWSSDAFIGQVVAGVGECDGRQGVRRYLAADIDDFKEDFPRLPDEANPFDRDLAQPHLLGDANARNMFAKDAYLQGVDLRHFAHLFFDDKGGAKNSAEAPRWARALRTSGFATSSTTLDLTAPLLQLFWQTLCPWNNV